MIRPEITSPGFDFRDDRELFKLIGNMVPGATADCCSKAVPPLTLKAPKVASNSPRSLVRVLLGMKIPSRPLRLRITLSPFGIATKAWPEAAYAYFSPSRVRSPVRELLG